MFNVAPSQLSHMGAVFTPPAKAKETEDVSTLKPLIGKSSIYLLVVAETASKTCPYQTPGARFILPAPRSAPSVISELSLFILSKLYILIQVPYVCRLPVECWSSVTLVLDVQYRLLPRSPPHFTAHLTGLSGIYVVWG